MNSPGRNQDHFQLDPLPRSTASSFGGLPKAVPAIAKSTRHPVTKFLIPCPPISKEAFLARQCSPRTTTASSNAAHLIADGGRWEVSGERPPAGRRQTDVCYRQQIASLAFLSHEGGPMLKWTAG